MVLSGISPAADAKLGLAAAGATGSTPGKVEFLTLLATQLRYQNPLEPMSEHDMVSQLATFSMLDELGAIRSLQASSSQELEARLMTMTAVGLLGRHVTALVGDEAGMLQLSGLVEATRWDWKGGAEVMVDGRWISWHQLTGASLAGGDDDG